jgi:hypothetical protein
MNTETTTVAKVNTQADILFSHNKLPLLAFVATDVIVCNCTSLIG